MNLSHLRYITEVAKTGSITKAAQNLYMGQPNLSKAIREMEKSLGYAVFKRTSKGVEPTDKGRAVVERAKKLLNEADSFEKDFFSGNSEQEKVTAGICGSEYCINLLESAVSLLSETKSVEGSQNKTGSLEYFRVKGENIAEMVKNEEISFGIIRCYRDLSELENTLAKMGIKSQLLAKGEMTAALNSKCFCHKESISFSELCQMTEIYVYGTKTPHCLSSFGVSDEISGQRVVSKSKKSFMIMSSFDSLFAENTASKTIAPSQPVYDLLIYLEKKRFSSLEKEIVKMLAINRENS